MPSLDGETAQAEPAPLIAKSIGMEATEPPAVSVQAAPVAAPAPAAEEAPAPALEASDAVAKETVPVQAEGALEVRKRKRENEDDPATASRRPAAPAVHSSKSPMPASPLDAPSPSAAAGSTSNASSHSMPKRGVERVFYGSYEIKTWYPSPYPLDDDGGVETPASGTPSSTLSRKQSGSLNRKKSLGAASPLSTAVAVAAGDAAVPVPALAAPGPHPGGALAATADGAPSHTSTPAAAQVVATNQGRSIWVCDGCFKYMRSYGAYRLHKKECTHTHPPGRKVYQRGAHIIWEVDGDAQKLYAQNLSLFGKLFIDHKAICFDVEPFLFYVLTDASAAFDHPLGFFSKEKVSYDDYNLACIITFPPFQRRGFGTLLIEFSYFLSAQDVVPGTPERPLSSLGFRGYLAFWSAVVLRTLALAFDDVEAATFGLLLAPPPLSASPAKAALPTAHVALARARQAKECLRIRRALLGLPELSNEELGVAAGLSAEDREEDEAMRKKVIRAARGFAGTAPRVHAASAAAAPPAAATSGNTVASGSTAPTGRPARATRTGSVGSTSTEDAPEASTTIKVEPDAKPPSPIRTRNKTAAAAPPADVLAAASHASLALNAAQGGASIALLTNLERLSKATHLRVDDVAFALAECGLLRFKIATAEAKAVEEAVKSGTEASAQTNGKAPAQGSTDEEKKQDPEAALFITLDAVRAAMTARKVKRPVLDEVYVL